MVVKYLKTVLKMNLARCLNTKLKERSIPGGKRGCALGIFILILVALFFKLDPSTITSMADGLLQRDPKPKNEITQTDETRQLSTFVSAVLAETKDTWKTIFASKGGKYHEPTLVLLNEQVGSICKQGQAATNGPFYCSTDQKLYIDLGFYQDLENHFDAPGDLAQAYVIAHEVGHHVQNIMGITNRVAQAKERFSIKEYNRISLKLELQADCYAGIWANHTDKFRNIVIPGDIAEALAAASQIGEDRLLQQVRDTIPPEVFNHGSIAQRVKWFKTGYKEGTLEACDTF